MFCIYSTVSPTSAVGSVCSFVMASNVKLTDNYIIFDDNDAMIINLSSDIGNESTADLTFDINNSFSNIINLNSSSKSSLQSVVYLPTYNRGFQETEVRRNMPV